MIQLQLDQYRKKAATFALEWANERDEKGEAHSFWDAFFKIFDLERRHFARHESRVSRVGKGKGFIDLFWPGKLLVEHKSAHKNRPEDWADTLRQALEYIQELEPVLRPKVVVLCNFRRFQVFDLANNAQVPVADFEITELAQRIEAFECIPRFAGQIFEEEETANLRAIEYMAAVHEVLYKSGYRGRDLELLLVRVLFCLFAEDTGIFEHKQFSKFIEHDTLENGSDIGEALVELFAVLDTPVRGRGEHIQGRLRQFPYVNGGLFAEPLSAPPPALQGIRNVLLNCAPFDWSEISPEIFGSLFQAVLSSAERRSLGAHFTSERNIRRLIEPLFLRDLWAELAEARHDAKKLEKLRRKIGQLRFLDPACGCGNFLVVTYRELRLLDIEILKLQFAASGQYVTDVGAVTNVRLEQMYGLEIKPVSALIAQTALWLTDHQCNRLLKNVVGLVVASIPLAKTSQILTGNALQTDWGGLLSEGKVFDFVIGNPPFLGHHYQNIEQKADLIQVFNSKNSLGTLDFVCCWFIKAARLIQNTNTKVAFVSTNSISQGEQVGLLWNEMWKYKIFIHFAHNTFRWNNEAPGVAAVHCVIIGFAAFDNKEKWLFDYSNDINGDSIELKVKTLNPYLIEAQNILIINRAEPLCGTPRMLWGNKPTDGGSLLFDDEEELQTFLKKEAGAKRWIRPYMGGEDFIKNKKRWCLWLKNITPPELDTLPEVKQRVESVRKMRLESKAEATRKKANTPHVFAQVAQPETDYIAIPEVSSERRRYIPIAFISREVIASNTIQFIPSDDLFLFGVLTSEMHMAWMRYVCGRLKSDYRYSNSIVYNNFPFPTEVGPAQRAAVEAAAQAVLDVRARYQTPPSAGDDPHLTTFQKLSNVIPPKLSAGRSLADLYDPNKMPADLLAAHQTLDRAVDAAYGLKKPFATEAKRVAWLFERYGKLVGK